MSLASLLERLDHAERAPTDSLPPSVDGTRYPGMAWDLRTLIAVFPPEAPLRFLNLNTTLGRIGTGFDTPGRDTGRSAKAAFDLQMCLEGRGWATTYKEEHGIGDEVRSKAGAVDLDLPGRLRIVGAWPDYTVEYRQPEADLELDVRLTARPGVQWWAALDAAYGHYSSFVQASVRYRRGAEAGNVDTAALFDHGWGRRAPRGFGGLLERFRYEVLGLPGAPPILTLTTHGPRGAVLRSGGNLDGRRVRGFGFEVLEWSTRPNAAGALRRVPQRWVGRLGAPGAVFVYEAALAAEPRPILGDGFLAAFDFAVDPRSDTHAGAEGEGYCEMFGAGWIAGRQPSST